jgi:hypothetical protein
MKVLRLGLYENVKLGLYDKLSRVCMKKLS